MGSKAPAPAAWSERRAPWSLEQLDEAVLSAGPAAIEPQNLSDTWLMRLAVAAELVVTGDESNPDYEQAFDAMVSIALLGVQAVRHEHGIDAGETYVNLRQLWRHIRNYRQAVVAELATRRTGITNPLANLSRVFAHRTVARGMRPTSIEFQRTRSRRR